MGDSEYISATGDILALGQVAARPGPPSLDDRIVRFGGARTWRLSDWWRMRERQAGAGP